MIASTRIPSSFIAIWLRANDITWWPRKKSFLNRIFQECLKNGKTAMNFLKLRKWIRGVSECHKSISFTIHSEVDTLESYCSPFYFLTRITLSSLYSLHKFILERERELLNNVYEIERETICLRADAAGTTAYFIRWISNTHFSSAFSRRAIIEGYKVIRKTDGSIKMTAHSSRICFLSGIKDH